MSHFSSLSLEAGSQVARGLALFSIGVDQAAASVRRQQACDLTAVENLAVTHVQTRRALVAARAETVVARETAECLGRELSAANARADRAEAALGRLLQALHA